MAKITPEFTYTYLKNKKIVPYSEVSNKRTVHCTDWISKALIRTQNFNKNPYKIS